jgi:microcystin-dependent protein
VLGKDSKRLSVRHGLLTVVKGQRVVKTIYAGKVKQKMALPELTGRAWMMRGSVIEGMHGVSRTAS